MKLQHTCSRTLGIAAVLAIASGLPVYAKSIWYVDAAATGTGAGTSWANAFVTVTAAIAAASATVDAQGNSDEIWVVTGTYYTPVVGGVSVGYAVTKPLKFYGGFAGGENSVAVNRTLSKLRYSSLGFAILCLKKI